MEYEDLPSRLGRVRDRIAGACARVGRAPDEVTIVAVTKTHPPAAVLAARAAGIPDVGENRVQELETKVEALGRDAARWHLIGHLQRNKARRAIALADLIHSVDSVRIAKKLSEEACAIGGSARVLLQIDASGEATKGGIPASEALERIAEVATLPGLEILGLMTMAPFTDEETIVRRVFAATRRIGEEARAIPGFELRHLSMGMSNDFEIAIEEGSTLVRLGTILFGERE